MAGVPALRLLVFGPNWPQWNLKTGPGGAAQITVRDVYCMDLTPRYSASSRVRKGPIDDISWQYLLANTTGPDGEALTLDRVSPPPGQNPSSTKSAEDWIGFTSGIRDLCQSDVEKAFYDKFLGLYLKHLDPSQLWSSPALIPQVWVNIEPGAVTDPVTAARRQRTPFRVDFLLICLGWDGEQNIVVEIDGHQHYSNPDEAAKTLAKSRHLTRMGWTHVRFHRLDVERLSPEDLWSELPLHTFGPHEEPPF